MGKKKVPSTPALRWLAERGVSHEVLTYAYVERGGTRASSQALGLDEHVVIKTLVFLDDVKRPLIVCMHGDRSVSEKALARALGVKSVRPAPPEIAQRHSGYRVGGTSPFGLRKPLPVYVEASVFSLERIVINGGARGLLVRIAPVVLEELGAQRVSVARQ